MIRDVREVVQMMSRQLPLHAHSCSKGCNVARRADSGAVAVIVAVVIVVLIGLAAIVIDVGSLYAERAKLQTAADASALAAVREVSMGAPRVNSIANRYVSINASEASAITVSISSSATGTIPFADTVSVAAKNPTEGLFFARTWGRTSASVSAAATARIKTWAFEGLLPIGVVAKNLNREDFGFPAGTESDLQLGLGPGNYGWLTLNYPPDPSNSAKWNNQQLVAVFNAGGSDTPVYLTQYPLDTGEKTPVMKAFQDWWAPGKTGYVAVVASGINGSSDPATVIGYIQVRFDKKPNKNDVFAVYVRTLTEEDMVLSSYWPGSTDQEVMLVK